MTEPWKPRLFTVLLAYAPIAADYKNSCPTLARVTCFLLWRGSFDIVLHAVWWNIFGLRLVQGHSVYSVWLVNCRLVFRTGVEFNNPEK